MSTLIYACPFCSVLRPDATILDGSQGYVSGPWTRIGSRSKQVMFSRSCACTHGPTVPEMAEDDRASVQWNVWARGAAESRAKALGLTPRRTALFLYMLGMANMAEVLVAPEDPPTPTPTKKPESLPAFRDLEDRRRIVPIGQAQPEIDKNNLKAIAHTCLPTKESTLS